MKRRVYFVNLGCPKNLVDSEILMGELAVKGAEIVTEAEDATDLVVNTCGFIEDAKRESIETILEAVQLKKTGGKRVFVTGCLSQRYREDLKKEFPEVDGFFGARHIERVAGELAAQMLRTEVRPFADARVVTTAPAYAYVKIAEGCDNSCAFCAIPLIRGRHKSRPTESILKEVRQLAENGFREVVLISQDTTYYGRDLSDGSSLETLLRELEKVDALEWIRLLYTYPDRISDDLIGLLSESEKICPYIDVPIQHISDRILKHMRRGSSRSRIEALIDHLRRRVPGIAIRTSVMVGFPGETDSDFQELLDFVAGARFEHLGIFKYSREENTPSFDFSDQIAEKIKQERFELLQEIQQDIALEINRRRVGWETLVLVDDFDESRNVYVGRTQWDAPEIDNRVVLKGDYIIGEMYPVQIVSATEDELVAEIPKS